MLDKSTIRSLPCLLSQAEKVERSTEMAKNMNDAKALEEAITAYKSQQKAKLDELQAIVNRLLIIITSGKEYRMVPCSWHYAWGQGEKVLFRDDTSEEIHREKITEAELQERLPLGENENPAQEKSDLPASPDPTILCGLEGCGERFIPAKKGQKYHSRDCKKKADAQARKDKKAKGVK